MVLNDGSSAELLSSARADPAANAISSPATISTAKRRSAALIAATPCANREATRGCGPVLADDGARVAIAALTCRVLAPRNVHALTQWPQDGAPGVRGQD